MEGDTNRTVIPIHPELSVQHIISKVPACSHTYATLKPSPQYTFLGANLDLGSKPLGALSSDLLTSRGYPVTVMIESVHGPRLEQSVCQVKSLDVRTRDRQH